MTENQKIWLEDFIEEHLAAAGNETIWVKGSPDDVTAQMHRDNAEEHIEFVNLLKTLLENN